MFAMIGQSCAIILADIINYKKYNCFHIPSYYNNYVTASPRE